MQIEPSQGATFPIDDRSSRFSYRRRVSGDDDSRSSLPDWIRRNPSRVQVQSVYSLDDNLTVQSGRTSSSSSLVIWGRRISSIFREDDCIFYKVGLRFPTLQNSNQSHLMVWQKNHFVRGNGLVFVRRRRCRGKNIFDMALRQVYK